METERFVLNDAAVELETALLKTLAAARVAGIENRHVVFLRHFVDGCKERGEILFSIDVLFTMGR